MRALNRRPPSTALGADISPLRTSYLWTQLHICGSIVWSGTAWGLGSAPRSNYFTEPKGQLNCITWVSLEWCEETHSHLSVGSRKDNKRVIELE